MNQPKLTSQFISLLKTHLESELRVSENTIEEPLCPSLIDTHIHRKNTTSSIRETASSPERLVPGVS